MRKWRNKNTCSVQKCVCGGGRGGHKPTCTPPHFWKCGGTSPATPFSYALVIRLMFSCNVLYIVIDNIYSWCIYLYRLLFVSLPEFLQRFFKAIKTTRILIFTILYQVTVYLFDAVIHVYSISNLFPFSLKFAFSTILQL